MGKTGNVLGLMCVVLSVGVLAAGVVSSASGKVSADELVADAGPDQTVPGPSPVDVQLNGDANANDYTCMWYNQWGQLRAEGCHVTIEVNFGNNDPKPGTKRAFTLKVKDDQGSTAEDKLVVILGEPEDTDEPPSISPPVLTNLEGIEWAFADNGFGTALFIEAGFGTDDSGGRRWYVRNFGGGLDGLAPIATVACLQGTHWFTPGAPSSEEKGFEPQEGCISDPGEFTNARSIDLTGWRNSNYWTVSIDGENVATLTPWGGQQPADGRAPLAWFDMETSTMLMQP